MRMNLICLCGHQYKNVKTGVRIIEYDAGGPCRIWGADLMQCGNGHKMLRTAAGATERWHTSFDEEHDLVIQGEKGTTWFELDLHVHEQALRKYDTKNPEEE